MTANPKIDPMFAPNWDAPPVFFLHIPKTAGSSNNQFLRGVYGAGNSCFHVENNLPSLDNGAAPTLRVDCISGHVPLWAWHLYPGSEHYARVTLLRDPWARVVSHINWVNLFNLGMKLPNHGPGAADLAHVVDLLAITDFEDRGSLITFFDAVSALPLFTSFDNYQVRMLRLGAMDAMTKNLGGKDVDAACDALSGFFHVGFCEDQNAFQKGFLEKSGLHASPAAIALNPARSKILTPNNDIARQAFAPWYEKDQALYGYMKGLQAHDP